MACTAHVTAFLVLAGCTLFASGSGIENMPTDISQYTEDELWKIYLDTYSKKYDTPAEEYDRKCKFRDNVDFVKKHNDKYRRNKVAYNMRLNYYDDLDAKEFADKMLIKDYVSNWLGYRFAELLSPKPPSRRRKKRMTTEEEDKQLAAQVADIGAELDLRSTKCINRVKYQICGSCYAYAAVTLVEYFYCQNTGYRTAFHEEDIMDCSRVLDPLSINNGCKGGNHHASFVYIQQRKGLATLKQYTDYPESDNTMCKDKSPRIKIDDLEIIELPSSDEEEMKKQMSIKNGPIAIGFSMVDSLRHYSDGVYSDTECNSVDWNHAMSIIGYGTQQKHGDYWLVRNSWGPTLGKDGYFLIARGSNMCKMAVYPEMIRMSAGKGSAPKTTAAPEVTTTKKITTTPKKKTKKVPRGKNCKNRNPCTARNRRKGRYHFPYRRNPRKYVQCGPTTGMCYVKKCASGTRWSSAFNACSRG